MIRIAVETRVTGFVAIAVRAMTCRMPHFDQRELNVVDRQRVARIVVEVLERGEREFRAAPADRDAVATALQGDVERVLDLPQIFVERAAEVGEPRVVVVRAVNSRCC